MNYATKRLFEAAQASLAAWQDDERSVQEDHRKVIEELENAIFYFYAHGEKENEHA